MLKKKYRHSLDDLASPIYSHLGPGSPLATPDLQTPTSPLRDPPPYRPPPPAPLSPTHSVDASSPLSLRSPPEELYATVNKPNRAPPVPLHNSPGPGSPHRQNSIYDETPSEMEDPSSPPVPPRRKSQDKLKLENKENVNTEKGKNGQEASIKVIHNFLLSPSIFISLSSVVSFLISVHSGCIQFARSYFTTASVSLPVCPDFHANENGNPTTTVKRALSPREVNCMLFSQYGNISPPINVYITPE